jgi:2-polyprenyl-3-methyl-5-hydroxy-6-metoxy-1,4-benzoquinol methylase
MSASREPTSHERMSGRPWDASYQDGPAPWDIGGPQPAIARLAAAGAFSGRVLDAGCGTGDNALCLAAQGLTVLGFDVAETAVAMARQKARDRGLQAEFVLADAFQLAQLQEPSTQCWTAVFFIPLMRRRGRATPALRR